MDESFVCVRIEYEWSPNSSLVSMQSLCILYGNGENKINHNVYDDNKKERRHLQGGQDAVRAVRLHTEPPLRQRGEDDATDAPSRSRPARQQPRAAAARLRRRHASGARARRSTAAADPM